MVKLKNIVLALSMCFVLSGLAAAEYPDAGSTWSSAKQFPIYYGYNQINGQLSTNPVDQVDYWKNTVVPRNSKLTLYLDSASVNDYVQASLYDNINGAESEMQRIYRGGGAPNFRNIVNNAPVGVKIIGHNLNNINYQFKIQRT